MLGQPTFAATTTYTGVYAGGTIAPGDTVVLSNGASIAGNVVANGTLRFDHTNSNLIVSNTISGTGRLWQSNTGTLSLQAPLLIGYPTFVPKGSVELSAGTMQINSGTGRLELGYQGQGSLLLNGGRLLNSQCKINSGTATLSSGQWITSGGDFYVGNAALRVSGGLMESPSLFLFGDFVAGTRMNSVATFSGGTSTIGTLWFLAGTSDSSGLCQIAGGTLLTSEAHIVASSINGPLPNVEVLVSSGTWVNSGTVTLFSQGKLTLNGGLAVIGQQLDVSANSTLNLASGGTLRIGTGTSDGVLLGGTGALTANGTLQFFPSGTTAHAGLIAGAGNVVKGGPGTLNLSGANSYTGGTTLADGVLVLGSADAIGSTGEILMVGGTLQFTGSNTTDYSGRLSGASGQRFQFDTNGQSIRFATAIQGDGNTLTKTGSGTLTLSAANTYSGTTSVSGGVLRYGVNNALASGAVTVDGNATLDLQSYSDSVGAITLTSGNIIGSGTLTSTGGFTAASGTVSIPLAGSVGLTKTGSGTLTLSGSNSFTGSTTISSGTLQIGAGGTTGLVAGNVVNNGGLTFNRSDSITYSGTISGAGVVTKIGTGSLVLSATNSYSGGTLIMGGTLTAQNAYAFGGSATPLSISDGAVVILSSGAVIGALSGSSGAVITTPPSGGGFLLGPIPEISTTVSSGESEYAGTIRHNGRTLSFSKSGAGSLILSGSNSYAGTSTLSGGTLTVGHTFALGQITNRLSVNAGTLNLGIFDVAVGALSGSSGGVITTSTVAGVRTFTTSWSTGSFVFAGSIQNNNAGVLALKKLGIGVLTLSGSNSFSGGTTLDAGSLIAGHLNAFGSGTVVINGGTLDLASRAIANQITNNGGTIINAANYGGTQSVSGVVSMTGTVGGTVNVAAAGELKGSGVVFNGPVTLASGAQHSPGNSPGTQTFNSGLSYSTGSILNWELITNSGTGAGTNYDFLSVTGGSLSVASGALLNLVFSGSGSTVSWSDPFWNANRSWTIIDALLATSSTGDFTLGTVSNDSLGRSLISVRPDAAFALDQSGNNVVLTFTAVPEPSTYVLALVGLGFAGWAMRRRKSHRARRAA